MWKKSLFGLLVLSTLAVGQSQLDQVLTEINVISSEIFHRTYFIKEDGFCLNPPI